MAAENNLQLPHFHRWRFWNPDELNDLLDSEVWPKNGERGQKKKKKNPQTAQ